MNILELERKGCFDYFWNEISTKEETFGLVRDNSKQSNHMNNVCSIAAVGFAFSAICIGAKRGYVSYQEAEERCLKTLNTLMKLPHRHGFFHHFINMETTQAVWSKEVSIIDTSLCIMGMLSAGEYFKGEVQKIATQLYERVDWSFYLNKETNLFYMGYNENGGFGSWNMYAEQLMMYFLAVASPTYPLDPVIYSKFRRDRGSYSGKEFIYTPIGSIFPYQFSHAYIDFRNRVDADGIDWFENSIDASKANYQFCVDQKSKFKTYHEKAWGLTACATHHGYDGNQGTLPAFEGHYRSDGTIPPCGSIGSIVFTPELTIPAMEYFYQEQPQLWGKYGFHDAYNLDADWVCPFEIGIDKGISIIMIENYETGLIWNLMNQNKFIQKAFEILKFTNK